MAFKALFIAHAPDGDPEKHHNLIETGKYKLYTYVVKSQDQAIKVCRDLYEKEKIDSVLLCPGFTHKNVAEIFEALGNKVAVCVSRGDGPSSSITAPVLQREFWGK
ncbi:MAG: DUF6506 family protein [Bacteroidales bacterium]